MNSGIFYLYEYENNKRSRNVGFIKAARHYRSCILQIHANGIPVGNGAALELYAFYRDNEALIAEQIAVLNCFRRNISARLPVAESNFPEGRPLSQIDGFLIRLPGSATPLFWMASAFFFDVDISRLTVPSRQCPPTELTAAEKSSPEERSLESSPGSLTEEPPQETDLPPSKGSPAAVSGGNPDDSPAEADGEEITETNIPADSRTEPDSESGTKSGMNTAPDTGAALSADSVPETAGDAGADTSADTGPVLAGDAGTGTSVDDVPTVPADPGTNAGTDGPADTASDTAASTVTSQVDTENSINQAEIPSEEPSGQPTARKIQRSDIVQLPRKFWPLANNSFLLHGYHNYNHLMLIEEDGRMWLGVPGIYDPQEARAADLFGFPRFTRSCAAFPGLTAEEKSDSSDFGHWCRCVGSRRPR